MAGYARHDPRRVIGHGLIKHRHGRSQGIARDRAQEWALGSLQWRCACKVHRWECGRLPLCSWGQCNRQALAYPWHG